MSLSTARAPVWYWLIAVLALLWMLFGLMALAMDAMMDDAALAALPEAQRALYLDRPQWLFVVYATAIFSGLAGAIGLLLRRAWSIPLLLLSIVAIVLQFGYTLFGMDAIGRLGAAAALPFPLLILGIGIALWAFALHARRRGWLR